MIGWSDEGEGTKVEECLCLLHIDCGGEFIIFRLKLQTTCREFSTASRGELHELDLWLLLLSSSWVLIAQKTKLAYPGCACVCFRKPCGCLSWLWVCSARRRRQLCPVKTTLTPQWTGEETCHTENIKLFWQTPSSVNLRFIIYKTPTTISAGLQLTGKEYIYMDSTGVTVTTPNNKLIDNPTGILANTLSPLFTPIRQMVRSLSCWQSSVSGTGRQKKDQPVSESNSAQFKRYYHQWPSKGFRFFVHIQSQQLLDTSATAINLRAAAPIMRSSATAKVNNRSGVKEKHSTEKSWYFPPTWWDIGHKVF